MKSLITLMAFNVFLAISVIITLVMQYYFLTSNIRDFQFNPLAHTNDQIGLCVFMFGTTIDETHALETKQVIDLYRDRKEVFFIMDNLNNSTLQYQICDLVERCIFIDWPRYNVTSYGYTIPNLSYKTVATFQYLYDNKYYNKCKWFLK
eukprot:888578_1